MPVYFACQLPRDRSTQCLAVWLLATSWSTFKGTHAKSIGFTQDAFCMTFSFPLFFIHLYSFPTFQMKLPSLQWLGERLQGADMHGNGYSGDTAAFLRLKHENCNKHTCINIIFSVQWTNTSSNNPSQDATFKPTRQIGSMCLWIRNRVIIQNCRPAKMGHMMQPSGEPAAPGMGWTVKIPRI